MAYSLYSLANTLEFTLEPHPKFCIGSIEKTQLELHLQKVQTLTKILENLSPATHKRTEILQAQIKDAAYKAQDLIEFAVADQILMKPRGDGSIMSTPDSSEKERFLSDLQQVIDELSSMIEDEVFKMVDQIPESSSPDHGISFMPDLTSQNFVVGLDKDIDQLLDRLDGHDSKREVIPIVGMGGIGKTTLAQKLYSNPRIISHFDCVAWATISQKYNVREILSSLVYCIPQEKAINDKTPNHELALILHQSLFGRRYFIVLDDIWDTNAWDEICRYFPDNNRGSRIILTTRELDVANYAKSSLSLNHQMELLDGEKGWDLFRKKIFGKAPIGREFEVIGRRIVDNCKGLPLAIHVISGLLSQSPKTESFWRKVANDVSEAASSDERFPKILSLSYNHLPYHLKPCFLYIGFFPEDSDIKVSRLTRLWTAEGFLKPDEYKSQGEVAEEYLNCLEKRSLLLVRKCKSSGKVKSYGVHDLLRDLCLREASNEKYMSFNVKTSSCLNGHVQSYRRFNEKKYEADRKCGSIEEDKNLSHLLSSRLLRVLDTDELLNTYQFPGRIFPARMSQLVNIRYLSFQCKSLPQEISGLWNLETLIVLFSTKKMSICTLT